MSRILKVSDSNYRVKVQDSGTIILDTGANTPPNNWSGGVIITGDLLVMGDTTTVSTANLDIEDNIIRLNVGDTGAGISEGTSGIEINRGTLPNAMLVFDESINHWNPETSTNIAGTFVAKLANDKKTGLQVSTLVGPASGLDLIFDMQDAAGVLKLANTTNYSSRITDDNHIPNRRWVTDYVEAGTYETGMADVTAYYSGRLDQNSGVLTIDAMGIARYGSNIPSLEFHIRPSGSETSAGETTESLRAKITRQGLEVDDIRLVGNTLQTITPLSGIPRDLILSSITNNIEINAILNLDDQVSVPSITSGKTNLYSRSQLTPQLSEYPGKTGIFFNNSVSSDELVSKNRALLFSMIF